MNLHDTLSMKSASAPVVGEIYHVTAIATREVPDTINGGKRMSVVLSTDKGSIYAPSAVANAYLEMAASDPDGAAAELIGSDLRCVEYFSKRFGKPCRTLEFA